jgi:serine O-acetyltransferase
MIMKKEQITNNFLLKPEKKAENRMDKTVDALCRNNSAFSHFTKRQRLGIPLPSRSIITEIVEELRSVLFPGYYGISELDIENMKYHVGATLDKIRRRLEEQVKRGLCFSCDDPKEDCSECDERAFLITDAFIRILPEIQKIITTDIRAAYEGDPAARSPDEAIFCYPGILAITNFRLAHELYKLDVPLIPRIITEHAHSITGIDIHPGASIGESFFIDHGTGVVIGETSEIGNRVRIYQGVTLGAKSFPLDEHGKPVKGIKRHPIVEDDVIIYSGATILGRITIGKWSIIGGNVWLTHSVPAGSLITQGEYRQELFDKGGGI